MRVRYSYLPQQFADVGSLWDDLRRLVESGDFTLGAPVTEFETRFADLIGTRHAIGVGSGTDALKLSLKAAGVGYGDEVITAANTFIATAGAIAEISATPVFIDCDDTFCMDVGQLEAAITPKTKAVMPVHYTGYVADMPRIMAIAEINGLAVIEDACQAILATTNGRKAGTWGLAAGFSLHPLKNLNVWGDAGIIVTDDDLAATLRLLRNHGMVSRDEIAVLGYNSRLDSLQAVVGNWLIGEAAAITEARIANAAYYDDALAKIPQITLPRRDVNSKIVYHLYMVFAEGRDGLYAHLRDRGIECKVHYPIPLHRQQGLAHLGYRAGDFPVAERHAAETITLPVDQHLSRAEMDYVIDTVRGYYAAG